MQCKIEKKFRKDNKLNIIFNRTSFESEDFYIQLLRFLKRKY